MDKFEFNLGIVEDPRSSEEKAKDYSHREVAGNIEPTWIEIMPEHWKKFTPREQDGSLSCCGQASAKAIEILNATVMSAHPIYRSRANFPDGGMFLQDVGNICKKIGTTTEELDPSQWQNETTINRPLAVNTPVKVGGYAFPKFNNIDEIAQAITLYKQCLLIFHCNKTEWTAVPEYNGKEDNFGHCVCAIDFFVHKGQKVLLIEDSTGHPSSFDKNGQRLITEDFLMKRCAGAMYLIPTYQNFTFTKTLMLGMKGPDVKELQKVLNKELGISLTVDGSFGQLTKRAVMNLQLKYHLFGDGIVGKNTNAVLNSIK